MNLKNKFIALATTLAMLGSSTSQLSADACCPQPCCPPEPCCAYDDCCQSTNLAPAIALGAIAIVAIVAVAVQNSGHHHHGHN